MTQPRRQLGLFLLLLSFEAAALAQCPAGSWVTLTPMNDPRQELAAAQLDGMIYAVAGLHPGWPAFASRLIRSTLLQ
jgi:hypothetical protein